MNLRGIEYDPEDKNLWVSAYDGAIYKIAGFETKTISSVDEGVMGLNAMINADIYPNPATETAFLTFTLPLGLSEAKVELYDIYGNKALALFNGYVEPMSLKTLSFSVKDMTSGMYSLIISSKDGLIRTSKSISIQR